MLRLRQSRARVAGVVELWFSVVDVTGQVTKDGLLTLSGSRPGTNGRHDGVGAIAVTLTLRADAGLALFGELGYRSDPGGAALSSEFGPVTHAGIIVDSMRQPLPVLPLSAPESYSGTWTGGFVVESCSAVGSSFCSYYEMGGVYGVTLDLHVEDGRVVGVLILELSSGMPVAVSGYPGALGFTLDGPGLASQDASTLTLEQMTIAPDEYGRLNGSLTYETRYTPPVGTPWLTRYEARLFGVTLRP